MLRKKDGFFIISLLTLLVIRLYVLAFPDKHLYIIGLLINHFWIGLLLFLFGFLFTNKIGPYLTGVGLGLMADEFVFLLTGGNPINYWSLLSVAGAVIFALLLFIFRKKIY